MRYAVMSDIHANYAALQAVVEDVEQIRTLRDPERLLRFWFLGDLVGRGPDPIRCIRWLREDARIGQRWIPGNHDEWLVNKIAVNGDTRVTLEKHRALLDQEENSIVRDWFLRYVNQARDNEQHSLVFEEHGNILVGFTHATVMESLRRRTYLWPWMPWLLQEEFGRLQAAAAATPQTLLLLHGHTHYPMWARQEEDESVQLLPIRYGEPFPLGQGKVLINPGSVGAPHDGDPRAAYAILDLEEETIEFRRVTYPIHETTTIMINEGYPDSLVERIRTGIANGENGTAEYYSVYRRPKWDLEPISGRKF